MKEFSCMLSLFVLQFHAKSNTLIKNKMIVKKMPQQKKVFDRLTTEWSDETKFKSEN